jgi:hypothetical protein
MGLLRMRRNLHGFYVWRAVFSRANKENKEEVP